MATLEDDKDINDVDDDEDLVETPEPSNEPSDPNESIEIKTDEQKTSERRQRRQERRNKFEALTQENARYRAEEEARRRQPAYQPPQQQQIHPAAQRLRDIDAREERLRREYEIVASRPGYDRNGAEEARYQNHARELQVERMATVAQASAPQINEEEIVRKINWRNFTSEHSDVHGADGNTPAWRWAIGKWHQLTNEGKQDSRQLAEDILDQARVRFGMKPRRGGGSAPTQADKQRFSGMSSRAGNSSPGPGTVQMGPNEKLMARIAFDGKKVNGKEMTDDQKYQYWANTVGKKLQEQKSKGG